MIIATIIAGPLGWSSCVGLLGLFFAWFYNITCKYTSGLMVETEDISDTLPIKK